MNQMLLILACVAALITLPACTAVSAAAPDSTTAVNRFGSELYRSIGGGEENVFYSAYSIHSALAMTLAGARGQTADQMEKVLHVGDAYTAAQGHKDLAEHLRNVRQRHGFELNIANSLWGEQSINYRPEFTTILKDRYGSELFEVDYKTAAESARGRINKWVSDQTKEKIPELIPAGMLNPLTRMVLVNAIYFKAAWQSPFEKSATENGEFRLGSGETVTTKFMNQSLRTRYAENDDLQVLELPYKGGANSMLIFLPKTGRDISAAEKMLDPEELARAIETLQARQVQVALPSFSIRFKVDLARQLASLGMPLAFADDADFSGMTRDEKVMISNVVHEAFVAVDEAGTEAAAATGVVMRVTAMLPPEEAVVFRADHPFVFAIRDNESGVLLFAGKLMKPGND